jgi:hypothetical protein
VSENGKLQLKIEGVEWKHNCTLVWVTVNGGDQKQCFAFLETDPVTRETIEAKAIDWWEKLQASHERLADARGLIGSEWIVEPKPLRAVK